MQDRCSTLSRSSPGFARVGCFPGEVRTGHTSRTRPIPCGDGRGFIQKEDTVSYISATRDRREGAAAAEESVDLAATVTAQATGNVTLIRFSVRADQGPGLAIGHLDWSVQGFRRTYNPNGRFCTSNLFRTKSIFPAQELRNPF